MGEKNYIFNQAYFIQVNFFYLGTFMKMALKVKKFKLLTE